MRVNRPTFPAGLLSAATAIALVATACARPAAAPATATTVTQDLPATAAGTADRALSPAGIARLRAYVRGAWAPLTRTLRDLPRAAADPKAPHQPGAPWPVYVAPSEDLGAVERAIRRALPASDARALVVRALPARDPTAVAEHGLLFLPRPYVVPGGRFNEMYGWDSYFIVLGLLADGERALARDMADDFLYEVARYGAVLNANRTYYLTRSQPPLLGALVLAVYRARASAGAGADPAAERAWLARAREALVATWRHWTSPPHLVDAAGGLSRYFDHGAGPAPEVLVGERDDAGRSHYDRVRAWYRAHPGPEGDAAAGYPIARYYRRDVDELLPAFYEGDRAMRESGFDPSDRFGRFGAETARYAPVCLNSLLHRLELDLAEVDTILGRAADAAAWRARAAHRREVVERSLWDEASGLYLDYRFDDGRRRAYPFATTFWPLWAGIASPARARRVRDNLPLFERPGGLRTSTVVSGSQWDAPFGWAPLQLLAVEGLRRYGFGADADRVARAFLSMLIEDLERRGTLVEKYDVERRTSALGAGPAYGYASNEVGFGWTNGVALELLSGLGSSAAP